MLKQDYREIPYNFTSADDRLIINLLFGQEMWDDLEELRSQRVTGRSARLVMRFMGDLFILRRNPFLYKELIDSPKRRQKFMQTAEEDLKIIEGTANKTRDESARSDKVINLVKRCREKLRELDEELGQTAGKRARIEKALGTIVGKDNVWFDPFTIISHATDATDWRLHLPVAIVRPSGEEQMVPLLKAVSDLGMHVIPRGGGTGLTGGCVPVTTDCVIINTEKLTRIYPVSYHTFPHLEGDDKQVPVMKVEAGVVTTDAMKDAERQDFVFATDPTSSWASTIGGNIAENAGGKKAVLWGTAIDNILSYNIAMPGRNDLLTVRRIEHPMRKIRPEDKVVFELVDSNSRQLKTFELASEDIRKKGLWKDITNKTLKGVPGLQKEGVDGIITSAEFVLYTPYEKKITFCLEFYGEDMDEASKVIVEISKEFVNEGEEALQALEHFDEEYIKAIQYKYKAARKARPKAVLLIDMVGHTSDQIMRGKSRLETLLGNYENTELFTAQDSDEAERFWRDRKRLGAISARTNAFKLNEDIVLPLHTLAEFTRFVDEYNLAEDVYNKEQFVQKVMQYLGEAEPIEDPDWLEAKIPRAVDLCRETLAKLAENDKSLLRQDAYVNQLLSDLLELLSGYERVSGEIQSLYEEVRSKRIVIATHMHAGDGNNHVNIPVFSNDREMMRRAEKTAEDVMEKAVELGGVVSGEHGIGITKMKFLEPERREELEAYRREVDPEGMMNPGMLRDPEIINKVFTPSFDLLQLEARILQHSSLEKLSGMISQCVRCGKCMGDCCVYYPGGNIFMHPRNKNLVIGSLIEALLYDMQRSHLPRFDQMKNLEEIADHCTMCGNCLPPCPVNIDTAEVTVLEREILSELGYKNTAPATGMSLYYLKNRNGAFNSAFRKSVVQWGGMAQQLGAKLFKKAPARLKENKSHYVTMLKSSMVTPSSSTLWDGLPKCDTGEALMFNPDGAPGKTVFYFPGCGSERLYSDVSKASIYSLVASGVRVVLPPPFLCCGFPARVNAKKKMHDTVTLRDTIILSQIRDMLGYINFDKFVVSCGTCRESIGELGVESIFDCTIGDIAGYVLENCDVKLTPENGKAALYHAPCHDSLEGEGVQIVKRMINDVVRVNNCCSEAGTLAISRPDISYAMMKRKRESIENVMEAKGINGENNGNTPIITNCPSCISGLGRNRDIGIEPKHIAVLLAEKIGGTAWEEDFTRFAASAEKVSF